MQRVKYNIKSASAAAKATLCFWKYSWSYIYQFSGIF